MKAIRTVLACIRKADQKYNLINHGDKIVVGFSGGKDSMILLYALTLYQKFSHTDFVIQPVTLDLGFPNFNPKPLIKFCESINTKLIIHDSKEVYKILSKQQGDLNHLPCSICSRMKKAAINKVASELGFNKVAFAHHADDAIETLFMNEIYGGRIATFSPKMKLERADITFIRPLLFVREKDITQTMKELNFIAFPSACPADKHTSREIVKETLLKLYKEYPTSKENFLTMLDNYQKEDVWGKEIAMQVNQNGLTLIPVVTPKQALLSSDIRYQVFIKEMKIKYEEEFIKEEIDSSHTYLIYLKEELIGTIRYLEKEDIQIGRFAILKKYRNKGYGKDILAYFSEMLWGIYNPRNIFVNAMKDKKSFYEKVNYTAKGKTFKEAGIPHIKMIYCNKKAN